MARKKDKDIKAFKEGGQAFNVDDSVHISGHIYAKTQEAYDTILQKSLAAGYEEKYTDPDKPTPYIFLAADFNAAVCGSCDNEIKRQGVAAHGRMCECCGEPVCNRYRNGGAIRLKFLDENQRSFGNAILFKIFGYRSHQGKPDELLLYMNPAKRIVNDAMRVNMHASHWDVNSAEEAQNLLEEAYEKGCYRRETAVDPDSGEQVALMVLDNPEDRMIVKGLRFETYDLQGELKNYQSVKIFNGKRYRDFLDPLPVPESFHLRHDYIGKEKHSLAEPDIHERILGAASMVSRTDYYYQDGRPAFPKVAYERMNAFVEHFVDVELEDWHAFIKHAPLDGPGFIHGLARWAAQMSGSEPKPVRYEPNFGAALHGMWKLANGERLSEAEASAYADGMVTPQMGLFEAAQTNSLEEKMKAALRAHKRNKKRQDFGGDNNDDNTDEPDLGF